MVRSELNTSQKKAMKAVSEFLQGKERCFILTGGAGTGKTTLIRSIGEYLEKINRLFYITATTGRAARILYSRTGLPARTVHSLIYAKDRIEFMDEVLPSVREGLRISFRVRDQDPGNLVLIIDEASMLGDKENKGDFIRFGSGRLLKDVFYFLRMDEPSDECMTKVIFVGDQAQLPPVGERLSPALSECYLEEEYGLHPRVFELEETMRQEEGSGILENAATLRERILLKDFSNFQLVPKNGEVSEVDVPKALELLEGVSKGGNDSRVLITRSNAKALDFNRAAREKLWGNPNHPVQVRDLLLVNKNDYRSGLSNGDLVRVSQVNGESETRRVKIRGITEEIPLSFRPVEIVTLGDTGSVIRMEVIILENLLDSPEGRLPAIEQRALLVDFRQRYPKLRFASEEFTLTLQEDIYFNALQVKYGYAITCHKAQGGEWEKAIVNFENGRTGRNEAFFRWSYTAVTRAKKVLFTIGAPSFSAFSGLWERTDGARDIRQEKPHSRITAENAITVGDVTGNSLLRGSPSFLQESCKRLKASLSAKGLEVLNVTHLQYCERYLIGDSEASIVVDCHYRKTGRFTGIAEVSRSGDGGKWFDQILPMVEVALAEDDPTGEQDFEPFARDLLTLIRKAVKGHGIALLNAKKMQYRLRVTFREESRKSVYVDFIHNGNESWTGMQMVGSLDKDFLQRLEALMKEAR